MVTIKSSTVFWSVIALAIGYRIIEKQANERYLEGYMDGVNDAASVCEAVIKNRKEDK